MTANSSLVTLEAVVKIDFNATSDEMAVNWTIFALSAHTSRVAHQNVVCMPKYHMRHSDTQPTIFIPASEPNIHTIWLMLD
jgi:hypothetical protein